MYEAIRSWPVAADLVVCGIFVTVPSGLWRESPTARALLARVWAAARSARVHARAGAFRPAQRVLAHALASLGRAVHSL